MRLIIGREVLFGVVRVTSGKIVPKGVVGESKVKDFMTRIK
jgi:hypothetical protein